MGLPLRDLFLIWVKYSLLSIDFWFDWQYFENYQMLGRLINWLINIFLDKLLLEWTVSADSAYIQYILNTWFIDLFIYLRILGQVRWFIGWFSFWMKELTWFNPNIHSVVCGPLDWFSEHAKLRIYIFILLWIAKNRINSANIQHMLLKHMVYWLIVMDWMIELFSINWVIDWLNNYEIR